MNELIKLTEKIKDENLRKLVVDFLENPCLSNKHFKKYPRADIETAATPFSISGGFPVERDVLKHTKALAELCESNAKILNEEYGIKLNQDDLIAAAILHDLMKTYEWERKNGQLEHTGIMLDHTMLATAELYHRGFSEGVIHIVASHFGENGPTPPRNFEALLFHQLDNMLSIIEYRHEASKESPESQFQMMLLDEETIKKLGELSEIEKADRKDDE